MPVATAVRPGVRIEMRPEGGKVTRAAGLPSGEGPHEARSVITAEFSPCKVFVGRGAR